MSAGGRAARADGECKSDAGAFRPVIDRTRCEGKDDCARECPYDVFEVRTLEASDRLALGWLARLKARAHGNRQAYAVRAEDCHACGICVDVCPENAIRLERG